jgi:hypothetical protein
VILGLLNILVMNIIIDPYLAKESIKCGTPSTMAPEV